MASQDGIIPIRVLIRVRPLSKKEKNENAQECVRSYVEQNQISCNDKMFAFDAVFDPSSSQDDVFQASAGVLVDKLFAGYNCTILAYGQTGSGKTHTMGTEETTVTMFSEGRGIVPRIVSKIFDCIGERDQPQAFNVKVSMLEVYDDKVIDLLTRMPSREGLQIREKDGAPFVQGLSSHPVTTLVTTMDMLEKGCSLRSKGETAMNATSSRSHAVFTIMVEKVAVGNDDSVWESKLRLVDLAGSERLKKTMAEGERKKEGIKINEGLHALGKVIQALSSEEKHIPYRDSKITRLLQDSLGGSSYTVMIACVSPADSNGEETLSTLRYADRVKSIKNKPTVQLDPTQALIQKLREENAALRLEVAAYRAGEVPDAAAPLSSAPPAMAAPPKALPLARVVAAAAAPSSPMGTPRRVVRREELDEASERVAALEKTNAAMKEKIAELVMYKARQSDALVRVETEMERVQEAMGALENAIKDALTAETPLECYERLKATVERMAEEKREMDEKAAAEAALPADDSKMEDSTAGGEEDEDDHEDHEEKMNGILRNTESLEREVDNIMREIEMKEKLVHSNTAEYTRLTAMEGEHKKQMETLTVRLGELQKERDLLQDQLKKISTTSKLSEERRKRLGEIEKELLAQRKKLAELRNIEKLKKQSDETVQRLKKEIHEMKALRVRTTKQIRAETDKYRQYKMIVDKKIAQMQSKERKRDTETARLKQNLSQQLVVVKRKYEEATAANKRLQQQLMRSKNASVDRRMDEKTDEMWKEHVHNELELVASTFTAQASTNEMINQRKTLSNTLNGLNNRLKRLGKEPPKKRRSMDGGEVDDEAEKMRLLEEKRFCEEEIDKINATIQSLQSNSSDVNLTNLAESRWVTVHTAAAAKLALKHLFEEAVAVNKHLLEEKTEAEKAKETHHRQIEKLREDLKKSQEVIRNLKSAEDDYRKSVNCEAVENEKRRGSLVQMILNSDRIQLTEEHMEQLRGMSAAAEAPKRRTAATRRTTRVTFSPSNDDVIDGPRERGTVSRYADGNNRMLNTIEAVHVGEDEMDTTMNDESDRTFRIDGGGGKEGKEKKREDRESKVTKRRTSQKEEDAAAAESKPKRMTRQTSKSSVLPESLRPSPIRSVEESEEKREKEEDDGVANATFIVPAGGSEEREMVEKENSRGGSSNKGKGATAKRGGKGGSPDDLTSMLNGDRLTGAKGSGGLGDIA